MPLRIEFERMGNNGYCRGCRTSLVKDDDYAVKIHSYNYKDAKLLFCVSCAEEIRYFIDEEVK